jgi:hypothetical protein
MRSGSTLLRVFLNSHSQIHAPHELHLAGLNVDLNKKGVRFAYEQLGITQQQLDGLLWDRLLAALLAKSGKQQIVNKTPGDTFAWRQIRANWPKARYIFLLRHPASVAQSWHEAHPDRPTELIIDQVLPYIRAVDRAREALNGHTIHYEDLLDDPHRELTALCGYLGVPFEPTMLDYGERDHGAFRATLGDWRGKIKTGKIAEGRPIPQHDDIPEALRPYAEAWGYLGDAGDRVNVPS